MLKEQSNIKLSKSSCFFNRNEYAGMVFSLMAYLLLGFIYYIVVIYVIWYKYFSEVFGYTNLQLSYNQSMDNTAQIIHTILFTFLIFMTTFAHV